MRDRTLTRPRWSINAFHRKVLTSPHSLHIVVEGKAHDGSYYGAIAESSEKLRAVGYQVTRVDTLGDGGGKSAILKIFASMKRTSRLVQESSSGPRVAVFVLDRDGENVLGGSKRSPHVLYTTGYDVECDILHNGSDEKALSFATGLPPSDARLLAQKIQGWVHQAADDWRAWILLCCVSAHLNVQSRASFGRRVVSTEDLKTVGPCRTQIRKAAGLTAVEFRDIEADFKSRMENAYRRGHARSLLKGKWLPPYLKRRIEIEVGGVLQCDLDGFERRVVSNYLAALDCGEPWALRYRDSWEGLLSAAAG